MINEVVFCQKILDKRRIENQIVSINDFNYSTICLCAERLFGVSIDKSSTENILGKIKDKTLYKLTDEFYLSYLFFALPKQSSVMLIGPFLSSELNEAQLLEVGEKIGILPQKQGHLSEIYTALPTITASDAVYSVITVLCEKVFALEEFPVVNLNSVTSPSVSPITTSLKNDDYDEIKISALAMENRYKFENDLIHAVTTGKIDKDVSAFASINASIFEMRTTDALRNAQNYDIIMNTLLRKAAENGGVHPLYIDRLSSQFAVRIEQLDSVKNNTALMVEMFQSYCRLVHDHSLKKYSPIVQSVILIIDSDLSADLSTQTLARTQSVSLGYLSAVF
ncbi:MAG: hypothetical protein IKC64_05435, partial [Clostridia bacterium]|nr:hypothetical protein [Clostridia bacterium]